jgi:predicted acylesterase/phospholipase RssA
LGASYEIGALCALEDTLDGIDLTGLDHYIGVSAGAFMAAALANRMRPRDLYASFIDNEAQAGDVMDPAWLMVPAYGEFFRRAVTLPGLTFTALKAFLCQGKSLSQALEHLGPALPTGVFSNDEVDRRLRTLFSQAGRTNDFRQLTTRLTLVATHLDSGDAAPFGRTGWDHVPISRAVQASSALPGLFPPVEIDGSFYVDGALKKTMHASVALDEGIDLVLCLNPLVPFDASSGSDQGNGRRIPSLVAGGLPAVLSQTFRSMIHSRMALGLKHYEQAYPEADIVLIEPSSCDPEYYLANTFSYANRRHLAGHAYQATRALLRSGALSQKLERHGIRLKSAVSAEQGPGLPASNRPTGTRLNQTVHRLHSVLDQLQAYSPTLMSKPVTIS